MWYVVSWIQSSRHLDLKDPACHYQYVFSIIPNKVLTMLEDLHMTTRSMRVISWPKPVA